MAGIVIKDLLPQPVQVPVTKKDGADVCMSVRGITLEETVELMSKYKEPLTAFFAAQKLDFKVLAATAPAMVAEIIALGADAKGQEKDIKRLPLHVQVTALTAVWEQTVPNVEGLLASLVKAAESLRVATAGIPLPLNTSSQSSSIPSSEQATH